MKIDPIVDEVRVHRKQLAEAFDNDIHKICDDLRRREGSSGRPFMALAPRAPISTIVADSPLPLGTVGAVYPTAGAATVATFRELLTARPFRPFRVMMSRGDSYEVRHPAMAMLTQSQLVVGIDVEDGVPAEFKMCLLLHVTAVEPMETATR